MRLFSCLLGPFQLYSARLCDLELAGRQAAAAASEVNNSVTRTQHAVAVVVAVVAVYKKKKNTLRYMQLPRVKSVSGQHPSRSLQRL